MKIFCYVRPWSVAQFEGVARRLADGDTVVTGGDFPGLGDARLEERFVAHHRNAAEDATLVADIAAAEVEDIRVRCRLLRVLDDRRALRLIGAMWLAVNEILDEVTPDLVFSKAIDSYVLDLLALAARRRGIPYAGLISLFVNDHYRLTRRGELIPVRQPPAEEVDRVLDGLLRRDYRPDYLVVLPSAADVVRRSLRNQVRNAGRFLYYAARRRLGGDPLCYHDWSSEVVSRERIGGAIQMLPGRADWRDVLAGAEARVFVPLQFFPEATVDYWCPDVEFIDYYAVLDEVLACLESRGVTIVIKEHPGALGLRPRGFYQRLRRRSNVVFVPTAVHSNDVVDACDAVVVWTGTVGFEAALRGRSVMTFGAPFYASGRRFFPVSSLVAMPEVLDEMLAAGAAPLDRDEQRDLVSHVLQGCLPGVLFDADAEADADGTGAINLDRVAASFARVDLDLLS